MTQRWKALEVRFKWGVIFSVVWLVAGLGYALFGRAETPLLKMELNALGDFFAGLSAPLAFMWLFLGYMQQGEEIKETRVEIKRQADSIEANEKHSRRDTFLRLAEILIGQLSSVAGKLALSGTSPEYKDRWYGIFGNGDQYVFYDMMLLKFERSDQLEHWKKIFPDEYRRNGLMRLYKSKYETLINEAVTCDERGTIRDSFHTSSMGQLYVRICKELGMECEIQGIKLDTTVYRTIWTE